MKFTLKLFPLMALIAAALGCSVFDRTTSQNESSNVNATASNSASNVSTGNTTASGDPVADIDKMADKFLVQPSFSAKMSGKGDKDTRTDIEYLAPDRFKIKTGPGLETIVIGKDVYLSMGNKWEKIPGGLGDSIPDLRAAFNKEGRKWFSDVKSVGEETVNGRAALVYQYHNKGPGNIGENDSKVWIAKDDGLPIQIEATYKSGALKSMLIEYDFVTPVKIEPPTKSAQ